MPKAIDVGWRTRLRSYEVYAPANRFEVAHGYKDRETVQLRLEDDGTVYARYTSCEGREVVSARDIPFGDFATLFKQFVDSLAALSAENKRAATAQGGE